MQDVKIVDIDNVQWNIKDQEARNKIAVLETLVNKLKEETEITELKDIVLNPVLSFFGTVIKRGKLIIVSGSISLSQHPTGALINNLPKNNSANNKDTVVTWTNYSGDYLGQSILSFDKGATAISIGVGFPTSYPAIGEVSFSYITE